ncbi:transglutaminase-like cysteine peptidase [uncultured Holdemanella sp.]|jgi:predicted transglutaminase-like cysteine proteinase|uniref:transglutaminase-like cysteine peptidase n=1 Tax=uncultured Holdemanella sp. TaxID=1763549 RepID=UPI0025F5EC79|nr:transglutaminase-like cysteine peptidase [uncultured Holdemanella sp.]
MIKNLFDTIELKFNTSYEKWNHIIQVETKNSYFKNNKKFMIDCPDALEVVKQVNTLINKIPYKKDCDNYKCDDYWATPQEFFERNFGDCEDFAVAKYFALKNLYFPTEDLRIVLVELMPTKIGHAVCAVNVDNTNYILDNLTHLVLPDFQCTKYIPIKSMNEDYVFSHIQKKKLVQPV